MRDTDEGDSGQYGAYSSKDAKTLINKSAKKTSYHGRTNSNERPNMHDEISSPLRQDPSDPYSKLTTREGTRVTVGDNDVVIEVDKGTVSGNQYSGQLTYLRTSTDEHPRMGCSTIGEDGRTRVVINTQGEQSPRQMSPCKKSSRVNRQRQDEDYDMVGDTGYLHHVHAKHIQGESNTGAQVTKHQKDYQVMNREGHLINAKHIQG